MITKVIFAAFVSTIQSAKQDKCIALAMSGGGSLGSYEAGALWGMFYAAQDKSQFEYDVITGVSAGSINLIGASVYEKGQEEAMIQDLSHRWATLE